MLPSNQPKFLKPDEWVVSSAGIEMIKEFESFQAKAYHHAGDVPTIGYGTTVYPSGKKVKLGDRITHAEAIEYLQNDLKSFMGYIKRLVKVDLTQGQIDALASFVYNYGPTKFSTSTLLKKLNNGLYEEAGQELLRWNKRNGVVLRGLVRRRKAELTLWNS